MTYKYSDPPLILCLSPFIVTLQCRHDSKPRNTVTENGLSQSRTELVSARIIKRILWPVQTRRQANPPVPQNHRCRTRAATPGRGPRESCPPQSDQRLQQNYFR